MPSLVEENRRLHKLMVEGVDVEFYSDDGTIRGDKVRLIDFDDLAANDWLATGQFTVIEGGINRRPDVVVFVNGLPLGVIELKAPGGENATLAGAHNQLQTYKTQIPSLFRTNASSSPRTASPRGRLADRRSRAVHALADDRREGDRRQGPAELNILIEGIFDRRRLLDLLRDFTVFGETRLGSRKDHRWLPSVPRGAARG